MILLITISYFCAGLFSVIADLNQGPMDAKAWTRQPTFSKILFFSSIWFVVPILETWPGQFNRARTIAFGLLGSVTKLASFTFYTWITWTLSCYITSNTIFQILLCLVIFSIVCLFIAPLMVIPLSFITLILAIPLEWLFPLKDQSSNIKWCRNCKFYQKSSKYEESMKGLWWSTTIPDTTLLPCRVVINTSEVWQAFFKSPLSERALFPKSCPFYIEKDS